jgi:hypothetical protein
MKLTLPRGFKTHGRAPRFRSAVKKRRDLKFESNQLTAKHSCCMAPHQPACRARSESQIETPVRSVKGNRRKAIDFSGSGSRLRTQSRAPVADNLSTFHGRAGGA